MIEKSKQNSLVSFEVVHEADETPEVLADDNLSYGAKGVYQSLLRMRMASVGMLKSFANNKDQEISIYLSELKNFGYITMRCISLLDGSKIWLVTTEKCYKKREKDPSPFPLVPLSSFLLEPHTSYPPIIPLSSTQNREKKAPPLAYARQVGENGQNSDQAPVLVNQNEQNEISGHSTPIETTHFERVTALGVEIPPKNGELFSKVDGTMTNKDVQEFIDVWNSCLPLRKIISLKGRHDNLRIAMSDPFFRANYREGIKRMAASKFLRGANKAKWRADVDWFLKDATLGKLLEGKYDDRDKIVIEKEPEVLIDEI